MRLKRRILSGIFALALLLTLAPALTAGTEAAEVKYLYIGDSDNLATMKDNAGKDLVQGAGWLYNKNSKELTLFDNFQLTSVHYESVYKYAYGISCTGDLTIRVIGSCNIAPTYSGACKKLFGIHVSGDLTVEDAGDPNATLSIGSKLSANGKAEGAKGIDCGGKLTVKNITVDVTAPEVSFRNYGIYGRNGVDFQSCTVTARAGEATGTGDTSGESYGISADGFTASGTAVVTGVGGNASSSHGIYVGYGGAMTVKNSAQVKGQSGMTTGSSTVGVQCNQLVCQNTARLTGLGGAALNGGRTIGVRLSGDAAIQNSAQVEATGGEAAGSASSYGVEIYSTSDVTVELTGGTLTCTGGSAEYSSGSSYGFEGPSNIIVSGGEMRAQAENDPTKGTGIRLNGETAGIEVSGKGLVTAQGGRLALSAQRSVFATAGSIRGGESLDGNDAVYLGASVKIWEIGCRYVVLDSVEPKFTAEPSLDYDNKGNYCVKFSAQIPRGGTAIFLAAWYGADGRLLGTNLMTSSAKKINNQSLPVGEGAAQYKLLYLDARSFVPLCAAWSGN